MKALILIGGLGTRLRPFTLKTPKPLLPLLNRPLLDTVFSRIRKTAVREVLLCIAHRGHVFRKALGGGARWGLKFRYVEEKHPLGTGGALRNAYDLLDEETLMFNGDIVTGLDLKAMIRDHRRTGAEVTIALTRVQDPTIYGLVETDPKSRIRRFLEKPAWDEVTTNTINAGTYILNRRAVARIPEGVPYSIERGLFPSLLASGRHLHGHVSNAYWSDIGKVRHYLETHLDALGGNSGLAVPGRPRGNARLEPGAVLSKDARLDGNALLGRGARVEPFARLAGGVSLGAKVVVGKGAELRDCVVLDGARIGDGVKLERCVIGAGAVIGANSQLGPGAAVADGSRVGPFTRIGEAWRN